MAGVCLGNTNWKTDNPSLTTLLESMLRSSGYRLKFLSIAPDFIFNSMGVSVAFIVMVGWDSDSIMLALDRVGKVKKIFRNCYVIFTVTSSEANQCFLDSYFRSTFVSIAKPPFVPVSDGPMALERMLNLAYVHADCKRQGTISQINLEREQLVCSSEALVAVVSSIPGLNSHDANTVVLKTLMCLSSSLITRCWANTICVPSQLLQGIGSIEEISQASREEILENTDLSAEKADAIVRFFNEPEYFMTPTTDF